MFLNCLSDLELYRWNSHYDDYHDLGIIFITLGRLITFPVRRCNNASVSDTTSYPFQNRH
jgi:hypothetical protein